MIGYQRVMTLEVWAKESRSFKAGKSGFQVRKLQVWAMFSERTIQRNVNVKYFHTMYQTDSAEIGMMLWVKFGVKFRVREFGI